MIGFPKTGPSPRKGETRLDVLAYQWAVHVQLDDVAHMPGRTRPGHYFFSAKFLLEKALPAAFNDYDPPFSLKAMASVAAYAPPPPPPRCRRFALALVGGVARRRHYASEISVAIKR